MGLTDREGLINFPEPLNGLFDVPADPNEAKYPLPKRAIDNDKILPNLLNDRLFYLAFLSMEYQKATWMCYRWYLWEIFGTNPGSLLEFCFAAQGRGYDIFNGIFPTVEGYLDQLLSKGSHILRPYSLELFVEEIEDSLQRPNLAYSVQLRLEQLKKRLVDVQQELRNHGLGKYTILTEGRPLD